MPKQLVRICPSDRFCRVQNLLASSVELIWPITELCFRQILSTDFLNRFYQDVKTGPKWWPTTCYADSKEGSPPSCSSFSCVTYDPPLLRLLSGERCLVFSELCWRHLSAGRPRRRSSNLWPKPFGLKKIRTHVDLLSIPRLWGGKCQNVWVVSKAANTKPLHGI